MPCYCDTPNQTDQAEIQERCKVNMYFGAVEIFTKDNLKKAEKIGVKICQLPLPNPNTALCNICKVLSQEQMQNIHAYYYQIEWEHKTLWDWYQQHCKDDKNHSEDPFLEEK